MILTPKQSQALDLLEDKTTNELLFGGGAGGGKSVIGGFWVPKMALKYPGTRWAVGRDSLKTLKETTLNTMYWVFSQQGIKPSFHYKYNEVKGIFTFKNGSEILLKDLGYYPSDPEYDELGSLEITGGFVDECNQVTFKAWQVLKSRIRYRLDEYDLVPKILGTCNPAKNWVFTHFYQRYKNGTLPANIRFLQSLLSDNSKISKHYRENLLSLDKASIERLLHGNWDYADDPTVLCEFDAICDCFTNDHVKAEGESRISADLAMQGRDHFVGGVWKGMVVNIKIDKPISRGKEIERDLKNLMVTDSVPHSRTVVDSDGLGAYLESYLEGIKEFHGGSKAVNATEFYNLKSECAYKLAEKINKREIKIICNAQQKERIIKELGVLKAMNTDKDENKKRIISKETMKEILGHSPDYLDMLLMGMYFEVRPALTWTAF